MEEKYIHDDYFLQKPLAKELYHMHVKDLPVIDFHNHLNPGHLATNKKFANLAEAWVLSDPYKHRAIRICGVDENGITGDAPDKDKFQNWAKTLPKTLGNPLFLWSALELKRIFGIDELLTDKNAHEIWEQCNLQLQTNGFGAIDILKKFKAEKLCTSDDLLDELAGHRQAAVMSGVQVFPSLRGDTIMGFDQPSFKNWFEKLQEKQNRQIENLDDYKAALLIELKRFADAGCRLADHSLDSGFVFDFPSEITASQLFKKWLDGNELTEEDIIRLKNHVLFFLSEEYAQRKWILQLHLGAHRHTSSRLRGLAGPAGGFATIGNTCDITGLCAFFDGLEKNGNLPKIILYTLNPADNEAFATLTGSYSEDGVPGKIQFGPAWWYNDHYEGIRKQLTALTNHGILSQFVGMTTDSRSVFSFSRHEYFRRILCNQLATWVSEGSLPNDKELLAKLVCDISYFNSKNWIFNS